MKKILDELIENKALSKQSAKQTLIEISEGKYNNSQIAAFLTTFMMRTIKVRELEGFREALLELCLPVDFDGIPTIDMCGTGGDGKNTFNISTLSSFVVAGAGIKVAKHGNYGVSSSCGSSNVMEFLGYKFTNHQSLLNKQLQDSGITFLHAPLFHPAMKTVAPVRKELGMKTFFNMLGPLVNPSKPSMQVTGVYNLELMRLYNYLLQKTDTKYMVLYALDGYDEISLTSEFKAVTREEETIYNPSDLRFKIQNQSDIYGGETVAESAKIFTNILNGKGTDQQNNVIVANSGMAIYLAKGGSIEDAMAEAKESLDSGKAKNVFTKLIA
ncbi:MAG: anthranilate phosphoribosyltransferase [Saprospiraceae bacterium]|jgi:anthranilate phosphoribosyltransferase